MTKPNNQDKKAVSLALVDVSCQKESIKLLRRILTKEQHRKVGYDEAVYVGESLIEFFEVLSGVI